MDEYISREALLQTVRNMINYRPRGGVFGLGRLCLAMVDAIRNAPAADVVEVRHGEWEPILATHWRWIHSGAVPVNRIKYRHNECGREVQRKEPYCPNCGAKMDGKRVSK